LPTGKNLKVLPSRLFSSVLENMLDILGQFGRLIGI